MWDCRGGEGVEVAIDPAELEGLDEEGVRALYEERLAQQRAQAPGREVGALAWQSCSRAWGPWR